MALFATGNPLVDNGLNTGASGLLGIFDPSKQAQAGYYGAETAKILNDTDRQRFQLDKLKGLPTSPYPWAAGGTPIPPMAQPPAAAPAPGSPLVNAVAPLPPGGVQQAPGTPPQAPSAIPPASLPPSVGTDGKPLPPDPNQPGGGVLHEGAVNPPGGGVKYAAPAQANGSPAPPIDLVPFMNNYIQAGVDPTLVMHMGGALLAGLVSHGVIDQGTANRQAALIGNTAPYASDQTRASNMETTVQTGRNAQILKGMDPTQVDNPADPSHPFIKPLSEVIAPGANSTAPNIAQAADDRTPMVVISPTGQRIPTTKGAWVKNPAMGRPENAQDTSPMTVQPQGGGPPTVMSAGQGMQGGNQPYSPDQARYDNTNVSVVTPAGEVISTTQGNLRAHPELGREYNPQVDGQLVQSVDPATKRIVFTLARKAPGQQVAPQSTDQFNAQGLSGVFERYMAGNLGGAQQAGEALTAAQTAGVPKQQINPDQQARMDMESQTHLDAMYPVTSGTHFNTSTLPLRPHPDTAAYHDALVRELQIGPMRNNPAAAVTRAWDMMREQGLIPRDSNAARSIGTGLKMNENPRVTGDGHLLIMLNKDAKGNVVNAEGKPVPWPGGGPRPSALANTVAGAPRGRVIGAAPPGPGGKPVPDGTPITGPNGEQGEVHGGQIYVP